MKIWELINKIKGTSATVDEMLNWMLMNKICPLEFGYELDEGYQPELEVLERVHCANRPKSSCGPECYKSFLVKDVPCYLTEDEEE